MGLFALLEHAAREHGAGPALFSGEEQVASFAGLRDAALRLAGGLAEHAAPGDCVLIAGKNRPELATLMFACWAAGLVVVPVNAKLHPRELADIARDSTPRWAFVGSGFAAALEGMDVRTVGFGSVEWGNWRHTNPSRRTQASQTIWHGCSTPAAPLASPRAQCSRMATCWRCAQRIGPISTIPRPAPA